MSKMLSSEGEIFVKLSDILPAMITDVVDARFKYLKELDFENHNYARKILEEEYNPAMDRLKKILENIP